MDAVSKVVNAASTAIWGDSSATQQQSTPQSEEPISGVQGKGVANDPYDAGNREEQPDAPSSEENTAPQEPRLDGATTETAAKDTTTGLKTKTALTEDNNNVSAPIPTPAPVVAAVSSSTPAEAGGSSATNGETKPEQRATESTEGQSSQAPHVGRQDASPEALRGPQGPAPHPAEEFEDEAKRVKPAKKDAAPAEENCGTNVRWALAHKPSSTNSSSKSNDKASQGSEKGNGGGKHSPLHKMKEKLSKVAHPRHGSNKA
ncbi:Solid-state culture expressed protein (Aos23) [Penicillium canariense]|uniref:Solid-state culture expressed protein (Aos23) n=1 Tax=Penicillium canariense TaxID=189055 RepID=A0A9W9LJT4_9EURO|nr:Solid-state culture expressed protein (Aos23) [Penicillium canariense]KAJ5160084.1 Solid-state culture expressed protein (Aos23) [Penicillium canariense]